MSSVLSIIIIETEKNADVSTHRRIKKHYYILILSTPPCHHDRRGVVILPLLPAKAIFYNILPLM